MSQITHLLFDCDNTLVLSEDLAFEACADLTNTILAKHGISTRYTSDALIEQFIGQKFCGMLVQLIQIHDLNIPTEEFDAYIKSEEDVVISKLKAKAKPCVGANEVLEKLHTEKKYGMAVVSSSALRRIQASLDKAGQSEFFPKDAVFSAATSLPKPTPKPDPAVYLFAIEKLGVTAEECIAVEDSRSGAGSACRANIRTIAYVGSYNGKKKQKEIGDLLVRTGCCKIMSNWCVDVITSSMPLLILVKVRVSQNSC
jgi:HAD superfamily hydrolase (TIGR01509 family)